MTAETTAGKLSYMSVSVDRFGITKTSTPCMKAARTWKKEDKSDTHMNRQISSKTSTGRLGDMEYRYSVREGWRDKPCPGLACLSTTIFWVPRPELWQLRNLENDAKILTMVETSVLQT